jgi:hypothetical protein
MMRDNYCALAIYFSVEFLGPTRVESTAARSNYILANGYLLFSTLYQAGFHNVAKPTI